MLKFNTPNVYIFESNINHIPMKKLILPLSILMLLFSSTAIIQAQNRVAKPFMKITVKDGKVVKSERVDTARNTFLPSAHGVDNNVDPARNTHTSMVEDTVSPDRAVRKATSEDPEYDPNGSIRTPMNEGAGSSPEGRIIQDPDGVMNSKATERSGGITGGPESRITSGGPGMDPNAPVKGSVDREGQQDPNSPRAGTSITDTSGNAGMTVLSPEGDETGFDPNASLAGPSAEDAGMDPNRPILSRPVGDTISDPDRSIQSTGQEDPDFDPNVSQQGPLFEDADFNPGSSVDGPSLEPRNESAQPVKGTVKEEKTEWVQEVLDPESARIIRLENDAAKAEGAGSDIKPEAGWETVMSQSFEGTFPATGWTAYAGSGYANASWDDNSYRAYGGSWSCFCADVGTDAVTPPAAYPPNMNTWAIYGPFDLSDATDGSFSMRLWLDSETDYDHFKYYVSIDGSSYNGYWTSGYTGGWTWKNIDFKNVPNLGDITGESSVYIAIAFSSDVSNQYEGAFVDDILVEKYVASASAPDLWWSNMALSTSSWEVGATVSSDLTVDNLGNATSGAHYTRIYLSSNTTISTSDTQLGGDLYYGSISAGSSSTYYGHTFTVPDVADGTYYLGALVDYYDNVVESDETNNAGYRSGTVNVYHPVGSPDLWWSNMALSTSSWEVGATVSSDLTVDNLGDGDAGFFYSRIYLSSNTTISTSDTQLGGDLYYSSVSAGGNRTVYGHTFTVPDVLDGTYYVGALVDVYGSVAESDETNNAGYRSGTVNVYHTGGSPDLWWSSMPLSTTSWEVGATVTADLTVDNLGDGDAGYHYTQIYLSSNDIISTGDIQLGGDLYFGSITAGGNRTVYGHPFTVPDVTDGTYYVGAIVDVYYNVAESNESNNTGYRSGTVNVYHPTGTTPDLRWSSMPLSAASWVVGASETADLIVMNQGDGDAGFFYCQIYLSADDIIGSGDIQLGGDLYYSSISAGSTGGVYGHPFTVPDVTDGTYYVGAVVDVYNSVTESDETNNSAVRGGQVVVSHVQSGFPDLRWSSMPLSTTSWQVGETVTADLTVENLGDADAGYFYSRIYLSDNTTISTSDIQLGSDLYFPYAYVMGQWTVTNHSFTVPDVTDGTYYVGALVDVFNSVAESDETNNAGYRSGTVNVYHDTAPDLWCSSIPLSTDQWLVGSTVIADMTIDNLGDADAGAQYARLYVSSNDIISSGDTQLGGDLYFASISAGSNRTVYGHTFTVPDLADATYWVGAIVDVYGAVSESDETNNIARRSGTVDIYHESGSPDLWWSSLALSTTSWLVGSTITADLTVDNLGDADAGYFYSRIYLSDDDIVTTSDYQLGGDLYYSGVTASSSGTVTGHSFTVPDWTDGTYYLGAIVDVYNSVAESNEGNNSGTRSGTVTIYHNTAPDLWWSSMALSSDTWSVGDNVTTDLTIDNLGSADAGEHYTRIYLSDNTTISTTDTQLGGDLYFVPISAGSSSTVYGHSFTVPNEPDGTYYLGALVDYYNNVAESDETNNDWYRSGTVTISGPSGDPDLHWTSLALSTDSWERGDVVTADLTVENQGLAEAGYHYSQIYLSDDSYIDGTDTKLGDDLYFDGIIAGASRTYSGHSFTVPDWPDGTYWIGALVDVYNSVNESDESNNGGARGGQVTIHSGTQPDLHWTSLSLTADSWARDLSVTGGLTVANSGTGDAGSFSAQLYISDNDIISIYDTQLGGDVYYSGITAGSSGTEYETFNAPDKVDGTYWVGALVDVYNEVIETDETNNGGTRSGTVSYSGTGGGPDLEWTSMALSSSSWQQGDNVQVDLTEINSGTEDAGAHTTSVFMSPYTDGTGITPLADLDFSAIPAGGTGSASGTFTVGPVPDGVYYLGALVDVFDVVAETNESNNNGYRSGTVTVYSGVLPDLAWSSLAISDDSWTVGQSVTADLTIENYGAGDAAGSYARLYLSTNDIISDADTKLGGDLYFGSITTAGNRTESETFTVPVLSDGTYWMGALVDVFYDVAETDESNNGGARNGQVTIYSGTSPDLEWSSLALSTSSWVVGNQVTADLTVDNIGDGNAGYHYSQIYLSDNDIISANDTQLGSDLYFGDIAAGNSLTVYAHPFTVPNWPDGTYWMGALVDVYNSVNESNETQQRGDQERSGDHHRYRDPVPGPALDHPGTFVRELD